MTTAPVQIEAIREDRRATRKKRSRLKSKKIWIDLDNSPHVPFFVPIIEELEKRGYQVIVTARDSYQVCELLNLHELSCRVIGKHYGKRWILKFLGTLLRAAQLLPEVIKARPDLAVSHTSRAQFLAASFLRIPTVIMFDYEFVNATGFLRPDWLFVPEMISEGRLAYKPGGLFRYHGLKEDVYVPRFKPDVNVRQALGIGGEEILATVRPPATEAHYHNPDSERLFAACLEFLLQHPQVRVVMLPRNERQATFVYSQWRRAINDKRIIIPERAVDGLNLIWNSDLVISGGGTMNREAAALGVPVYSIFRGRTGAVDEYLAKTGRLVFIQTTDDIHAKIMLKPRTTPRWTAGVASSSLNDILAAIVSVAEDKCLPTRL